MDFTIVYKCNCHCKSCTNAATCKKMCKKICNCDKEPPSGIVTKPFRICEGHGWDLSKYILITSDEIYNKYKSIPNELRYKHKYINQDLSINYNSYFNDLSLQEGTYNNRFSVIGKNIIVGLQGTYPCIPKGLELYLNVNEIEKIIYIGDKYDAEFIQLVSISRNSEIPFHVIEPFIPL